MGWASDRSILEIIARDTPLSSASASTVNDLFILAVFTAQASPMLNSSINNPMPL
ncbi:hypothetical protein AUR04nite_06310 [Glutamicibacter uratoxydans]|uniref:Uncharacterized protein n=1 Tax=Glutamicibacter uratoxydans TaxID=43667 RepID=A0A4Y4DII6_GLUUR|nr:hypothetical protein AUR04nite_06310 [Glutamicibacter uratoxydans]